MSLEQVDDMDSERAYPNCRLAVSFFEEVLLPPNPRVGEPQETSPWLRVKSNANLERKPLASCVVIAGMLAIGILAEQGGPCEVTNIMSSV